MRLSARPRRCVSGGVWVQDAMATEKLADGIRKFAADLEKLEKIVKARLA